jgi:threonine dehydratase
VGRRNFEVIQKQVRRVLTVSDDEIRQAMIMFWKATKLTIEPSSATVIAALKKHPELFGGRKVGAVLSGGNIHPQDWATLTGYRPPA